MTTPEEGYIIFCFLPVNISLECSSFQMSWYVFECYFFVFHECLAGYDVSLLIDLEKLPSAENEKGTNLFILTWFKAMIYRKLKGAHCSEPVKCRMPRVDLYEKG